MDVEAAVEAFVRGFAATRSLTHPYVPQRIEGAWVMRDEPPKRRDPRNEEWVAVGLTAREVDDIAGRHSRGRFAVAWVCPLGASDAEARAEFKALGYRLGCTEPLFVHDLEGVMRLPCPATLRRVTDPELAARLGKATRRKPLRETFFAEDSPWRQYVAEVEGEIVGWVASIAAGDARWCANLLVHREQRRKGIARALMSQMLEDDRRLGGGASVLLSSHTGAHLYPTLGYRQLGTLLLYTL